ncbi:MAG: molybdate ABC transporter substrate-binding protein [Cyanobacteria bacterium J06639_14]
MNRRHFFTLSTLALTTYLGVMGYSQATSPVSMAEMGDSSNRVPSGESIALTVSVAASVQDAMQEVQVAYQAEAPNVTVIYNFGSSGSLAQQVAQGAPVDVFLSASEQWMDELESTGQLAEGSRSNLLQNTMVLIAPKDNAHIRDFADLEADAIGKVAIGEPESVPAGSYAKEVLTTFNLFGLLQSKLVFGKDVRQVLSYVETGNVDAGLVYATDALVSDRVQVVAPAPADSYGAIVYPVAVVRESPNAEAAQAFVDFLASEAAAEIFEKSGFNMVE